jgi:hypothetical protein
MEVVLFIRLRKFLQKPLMAKLCHLFIQPLLFRLHASTNGRLHDLDKGSCLVFISAKTECCRLVYRFEPVQCVYALFF